MTSPTFNIGGIASGLDTNSIISQTMQIERVPLNLSISRRSLFQARNDAWSSISSKLSKVRDAVRKLDESSDWRKFVSATSSNENAASITATGNATVGNLTFTVDRLAAAHQTASVSALSSASDLVGAGTLSITVDGTTHDIVTDSTTTLTQLSQQISNIDGVSATPLQVGSNQVRLVVTASATGADATFTVTSDQSSLGGFSISQQGGDAQLTVGSGAGAITVLRASNTIDDLISGASITLKSESASPVTLSVTRNLDAAVNAVKSLITDMNSALATIDTHTKAATDGNGSGAVLSTDSTARSLKLSLRSALSKSVSGLTGQYTTSTSVGISIDRNGTVTFDESKLRTALESDFAGVEALFSRSLATTDSRVSVSKASKSSLDGTHAVTVTQASTRASVTGNAYSGPSSDESFDITFGATVVPVTVTAGADLATATTAIQNALTAAGITGLTATNSGGALVLSAAAFGSGSSFTVAANSFGLAGSFTGVDVAGTIAGASGTGQGQSLTGTGSLDGLILKITATESEVGAASGNLELGTVTIRSGVGALFDEFLNTYLSTGGIIDRATDRWDAQIKAADDRIADLEKRLERKEASLRKYWTSLETAMSRMSALSSQLAAGLASLPQQQR